MSTALKNIIIGGIISGIITAYFTAYLAKKG